jgi:hypothetical protein
VFSTTGIDPNRLHPSGKRAYLQAGVDRGSISRQIGLRPPSWNAQNAMPEVLEPQADRLDWASLSVEMRVPSFPYNLGYWEGPAYFDIAPVRILVHETIHFWQMLSMGFLTNLGVEVWHSLIEFEKTGKTNKFNRLQQKLEEKDPQIGFSALDLVETHARFWDIHILGPEKVREFEQKQRSYHGAVIDYVQKLPADAQHSPYHGDVFDPTMTAATYGEPYRRAIESWRSAGAVVMFPIAAYFALQTPDPVKVYRKIDQGVKKEVKIQGAISIHEKWREYFLPMRDACNRIAFEETGSFSTPGRNVLDRSSLIGTEADENNVYFLYKLILSHMEAKVGQIDVDKRFCFPGDPEYRGACG